MAGKRVLVLGAGAFTRAAFQKLRSNGFFGIAADGNPDAPGMAVADASIVTDIRDPDAVMEAARRTSADAILPLSDFAVPAAAAVAARLGLIGISEAAAVAAVDKGAMRERWRQCGVPGPRFRLVEELDDTRAAAAELGFPLVLKPALSGGGNRGVSVIRSASEVQWSYEFAKPFAVGGGLVLEDFVEGVELTIEAISHSGEVHILAISDKEKPALRSRVATSLNYPAALSPETLDLVQRTATEAVAALGITEGASHTEVIVNGGAVMLVETAARPGGGHIFSSIVEATSGIDMVRELARALTGERPCLIPSARRGCVYRFFQAPVGILREVHGLDQARSAPGVLDVGVLKKAGDRILGYVNGLERPGYAVVVGRDREEAIERADAVEELIRFEVE